MAIKVTFTAAGKMGIGWQPTAEGLVVGLISADSPARDSAIGIGCVLVGIQGGGAEELRVDGLSTQEQIERMAQRPVTLVLDPPRNPVEKQATATQEGDSINEAAPAETKSSPDSPDRAGTAPWPLNHPLAGMVYNHDARRWEDASPSHAKRSSPPSAEPKPPVRPRPPADRQPKRPKTELASNGTGALVYKRPQGRAPSGYSWNRSTGLWQAPDGRCQEPYAKKSKGKHKQPPGRPPKGQKWNFDSGKWEPDSSSVNSDAKRSVQAGGVGGVDASTGQDMQNTSTEQTKAADAAASENKRTSHLQSGEAEVVPAWLQETREEVCRFIKEHRILQLELGKQVGYSCAVISQWLRGIYAGNNEEIGRSVQKWLKTRNAMHSQPVDAASEATRAQATDEATNKTETDPEKRTSQADVCKTRVTPAANVQQAEGESCPSDTAQADAAAAADDSPGVVDAGENAELRAEILAYTQLHKILQQEVCNWIGYSSAVISQWKRGLYKGNIAEIDKLMRAWLQAHGHARKTGQPIVQGPARKMRKRRMSPAQAPRPTAKTKAGTPTGQATDAAGTTDTADTAGTAAGTAGTASVADTDAEATTAGVQLAPSDKSETAVAKAEGVHDAAASPPKKRTRQNKTKFMRWADVEEQRLLDIVDDGDDVHDWDKISNALGTGRSASAVHQHWAIVMKSNKSKKAGDAKPKPPASPPPSSAAAAAAAVAAAESTAGSPDSDTTEAAASAAASSSVNAGDEPRRPKDADNDEPSDVGLPQQNRSKRPSRVDKFYEDLAAGRRLSEKSAVKAHRDSHAKLARQDDDPIPSSQA